MWVFTGGGSAVCGFGSQGVSDDDNNPILYCSIIANKAAQGTTTGTVKCAALTSGVVLCVNWVFHGYSDNLTETIEVLGELTYPSKIVPLPFTV